MAEQLIESLTTDFDPGAYRDEYREQLLGLIERKAEGKEIVALRERGAEGDQGSRPDGGARGEHRRGQGQEGLAPRAKPAAKKAQSARETEKTLFAAGESEVLEVARGHEPPGRGRRS